MSDGAIAGAGDNPFSTRTALALVVIGALVFLALLWSLAAGLTSNSANNGGGHAASKGLTGYAAFSAFLEKRGYEVSRARNKAVYEKPGLLVLTPPQWADGEELERIVSRRRHIGPTLVVTPKWMAFPLPTGTPGTERGWVQIAGTLAPRWQGFLDDVGVEIGEIGKGKTAAWKGAGQSGRLPAAKTALWGSGRRLVPLVMSGTGGRILAAYVNDEGDYPALEALALQRGGQGGGDNDLSPIVLVFEPDLLNNYGFADAANARLAEALVRASEEGGSRTVNFDLTLNGLARSENLLTLAFTPPFLAATLCLLMAALAIGWRAFVRFGPPRKQGRAIAFGKRALVANSSGLLRRASRLHLLAQPYVDRARERIALALAMPRHAGRDATDAAIDRAMLARSPGSRPFTELARKLRTARDPAQIVKAAHDLHALERTLTR